LVPNDADTHNSLGVAYYGHGRVELAISETKRAIEINPEHEKAYMNLGIVYCFLEQYESAIDEIKRAIEINPKDTKVQRVMEYIHDQLDGKKTG